MKIRKASQKISAQYSRTFRHVTLELKDTAVIMNLIEVMNSAAKEAIENEMFDDALVYLTISDNLDFALDQKAEAEKENGGSLQVSDNPFMD